MKTVRIDYPGERTFQFVLETDTPNRELVQKCFDWFNHGSRCEHFVFLRSRARSMSVGDFVTINGHDVYQCESFGWGKRTIEDRTLFDREVKRQLPSGRNSWSIMNDLMREKELTQTSDSGTVGE